MADMETRVSQYVEIRDLIRAMEERHKEELAKPTELLEKLAAVIHRFMDTHGLQNLKTAAGTCYISTSWRASVADADAFINFIKETQNFDLIERRASSTAVKAYVEEHNQLPTGVNLSALSSIGVRRPAGKSIKS